MEAFSNMDRPKTRSSRPRFWTVFGLVYPCIRNPEFYKTVRHYQATLSFQSSLAKPNMYGTNTQPFTYLSKASPVHSPNLLQISPSIPEQPQESQTFPNSPQAPRLPQTNPYPLPMPPQVPQRFRSSPKRTNVCMCVCVYVCMHVWFMYLSPRRPKYVHGLQEAYVISLFFKGLKRDRWCQKYA